MSLGANRSEVHVTVSSRLIGSLGAVVAPPRIAIACALLRRGRHRAA